jgi:hypothetical protein
MKYGVILPIWQLSVRDAETLALADPAKRGSRNAFEGSVDEVAGDIRRASSLGCEWMTFDLPRGDVSGMTRAMERLAKEVRPAV